MPEFWIICCIITKEVHIHLKIYSLYLCALALDEENWLLFWMIFEINKQIFEIWSFTHSCLLNFNNLL